MNANTHPERHEGPLSQREDPPGRPAWNQALVDALRQEPLIEAAPSLGSLRAEAARPNAVFLGYGLCTSEAMGTQVPFDSLGMLLVAEKVRQLVAAERVVVMIADRHARTNGFDPEDVAALTQHTHRMLRDIVQAFGLKRTIIERASELHERPEYRRILDLVRRNAPNHEHAYFLLEVADIEFHYHRFDGIIKLGWAVEGSPRTVHHLDELAADERLRKWLGRAVPCVYTKPGRVLDDSRPTASPYVATDAARRVCFTATENVKAKLDALEGRVSCATIEAALRHWCAIASMLPCDFSGSRTDQIQSIITKATRI
jgi:hypothetical protein